MTASRTRPDDRDTGRAPHRRSRRGAVAAVVLAAVPYGSVAARATPSPLPAPKRTYALNISIEDGHSSVRQGDRLTYVTTVTNSGAVASPPLELSQTVVPGLTLVSSTPKATLTGGRIVWGRTLAAGRSARFTAVVTVGRLPDELRRLAAVICASTKSGKRPIVCASDLDLLPARASAPKGGRAPAPGLDRVLRLAGVAVLVLIGLIAVLRVRRRFRR